MSYAMLKKVGQGCTNHRRAISVGWMSMLGAMNAFAAGPPIPESVRKNLEERVSNGSAVGIVIGLADETGTSFFAFGNRAKDKPIPVDAETIFEIGSISKVFTALLLADAANRGEVRLDDPVDKFLPPDVASKMKENRSITLSDLATHRSGLPRMPDNVEPKDPADPYADYSANRLYAFLRAWKPPATKPNFEYSNLGAGLLGHVLTVAAKKDYETLVRERITAPLKMTDTCLKLSASQSERFAAGFAGDSPARYWTFDSLAGAGAIRSTATDMIKFLSAFLGNPPPALASAVKSQRSHRYDMGEKDMSIGLGWIIDRRHGTEIYWHNGGTAGFHSFCGFRPDRKTAVVVLNNSSYDMDDVGLHLLEPLNELIIAPTQIVLTSAILDRYVGQYELAPGAVITIARDGDALSAQLTGQDKARIYPSSERKFFLKVVDAQFTFEVDADGKATALTLHQSGMNQKARRLAADYQPPPPRKEATVDAKLLAEYVGRYQLAPEVLFDVKLDGTQLTAQLTGQQRFPVFPESSSKFFYKVVEAQLTFVKGDDGKVKELILHQGGRDQRAKRME